MIVELIIPIETLRGKLKNDGYYFRVCKGKQIVQHTPTQWKDTPARKAARERFIATYAKKKREEPCNTAEKRTNSITAEYRGEQNK